ncbi:hypothetical protein [Legionella maioricensis]|uniref:Coiled-coil protein n=1 Tax=Legionella maioricensis TaxID=2896528 RepID=A0A9X2D157_9GAMM|nr:hypothetical protein [Legionella maioricensis]MCL9684419.1 hypothetical protein [Legionella maioricensis]MCL9687600.1 hypothetical protein [Legionella maioricensis]
MSDFQTTNGQTQILIPLQIKPYSHKAMPTITGSAFSKEAGTVLYGFYNMEYLLPGGDRIRLIANHNQKTVQLMLFTHDPQLLKLLPGERPSSLVADTIDKIQRYRIRSESYKKPLSPAQQEKLQLANECINSLTLLLKKERRLKSHDHIGHEALRRKVISIIELCRDGNRMLANSPIVSEGALGYLLYDAHKAAQHHQFNRIHAVSRQDQMDFTKIKRKKNNRLLSTPVHADSSTVATKQCADTITCGKESNPCFVWDSELHIGHNSNDLDDALRTICQHYKLIPAPSLSDLPANRFAKLEAFFRQLWRDGQDWMEYLSSTEKPTHKTDVSYRSNGVSITQITPYYKLKGLAQKGYASLNELVMGLTDSSKEPIQARTLKEARRILGPLANDHWVVLAKHQQIILRLNNKLVQLNYFIKDNLFYPLPEGQDLYTLSQISKRHIYLPERASLKIKGFASRIPIFFKNFFKSIGHYIVHDLQEEFFNQVHATHPQNAQNQDAPTSSRLPLQKRNSVHEALESNGLLANGQTLEGFIKEHINNSPYVIARANHPPSPHAYNNPLHRSLGLLRHIVGLFIDTGERNPIVGSLAMAAYVYGAGAVLAPNALADLLTKLHLKGLVSGIEPTQKLAHWMSHGTRAEAVSASITYWQATVAGGNLDKFFIDAVSILKDDLAEVAIIAALALSLGYGITKAIPSLQKEMGDFPYTNYAALGGKGGAAVYDTIMHPGDDWLLGTCKWFLKCVINTAKLVIAPFFEGYYYGYQDGFVRGWGKSGSLAKRLAKQFFTAIIDLLLTILTIPLLEISALLIHIPFRGITNIIRKLLATLGNIKTIGQLFLNIAQRPSLNNYIADFRISRLYGFASPLGHFSDRLLINIGINILRFVFLPPLQLIKNILILPLFDLGSLSFRLSLSVINPISRLIAYALGTILVTAGGAWDNSLGLIFSSSATGLTLICNWLDNKMGELKQYLLSLIEIVRGELYHWAFVEEDAQAHTTLNELEYYCSQPRRFELIPHDESHCLLHNLLDKSTDLSQTDLTQETHYDKLFKAPSSTASEPANQERCTLHAP